MHEAAEDAARHARNADEPDLLGHEPLEHFWSFLRYFLRMGLDLFLKLV